MTEIAAARAAATRKYRPDPVRILFMAESPPAAADRHFYFEDVPRADGLWVSTMRALYGEAFGQTARERPRKGEWLSRFQEDGFWMLEALPDPVDKKKKETQIRENADAAQSAVRDADPQHVILIAAPVYKVLADPLREAGFSLPQTQAVPFPGRGQQGKFQTAMEAALAAIRD